MIKKKIRRLLAGLVVPILAISMSPAQAVPTVFADTFGNTGFSAQQNVPQAGLPQIPSVPNPLGSLNVPQTISSSQTEPPKTPPVLLPYGELLLKQNDLTLNSYALPISIDRMYRNSLKSTLSPFGYGWTFPYQQYIQMYADFNIAQFLPDGTNTDYTFHKSDPNLFLNQFDGDPLIYYPLDKGSYTTDGFALTKLTRISRYNYQVTQPDGTILTFYGYNIRYQKTDKKRGKLIAITDRHGNTVNLSYDGQGNLTQITDVAGKTVKFTYSGNLISSMVDPIGQTTYYSYSGNVLTKVTHPDKTTEKFTYDSDNRLTSVADSKAGLEQYVYMGDRVSQINDNHNLLYRIDYNDGNREVILTDANGFTTHYQYDENNLITHMVDAVGDVFNVTYTSSGQIASMEGPLGTTNYTYDENQNVISEKDPNGTETNTTYNSNNAPLKIQDSQGQTWSSSYNNTGDTTSVVDPSKKIESSTYDSRGLPTSYTDSDGNTIQFSYDAYGQLKTVTDAAGDKIEFTCDKDGRLLRIDYSNGNWWIYRYGAGNHLVEADSALGAKKTFTYNAQGLLANESINGAVTEFRYDVSGNLIQIKGPNGSIVKYTYNVLGQVTQVIEVTDATGPNGDQKNYTWDGVGRLASMSGTTTPSESYQYDAFGNVIKKVTPDGTYTYTWDKSGLLIDTYLNGKLQEHDTYDQNGNLISSTDANGQVTQYTNDTVGIVTNPKKRVERMLLAKTR